jgi:hypothetical protein
VLQSLIDNEYLIKVIDESGSTVEKIFGTWQNYIGNMKAGEGYYLKVTENCTLTEMCDGGAAVAKAAGSIPQHFVKEKNVHPFKPMSLYLSDITIHGETLQPGDEVAVFKNDQLVGSVVWQSVNNPQLLTASSAEEHVHGFASDDRMSFKIWRKSRQQHIDVSPEQCSWFNMDGEQSDASGFVELGSAVLSINIEDVITSETPTAYKLYANYPNPFNPTTTIAYDVPETADVRLEIYNTMGQLVRVLKDVSHQPGHYQVYWDGKNDAGSPVVSGVYVYKIFSNEFQQTHKMLLLK